MVERLAAPPLLPSFRRWVRWLRRGGAVVGVGSVIAAGAYTGSAYLGQSWPFGATHGGSGGGAITKTTANLWIDSNGGTCTRQATPGAYVDAQACGSMQAAQTAASAGDTIVLKCGASFATVDYPAQSISSGGKASAVTYYAEQYDQATDATTVLNATSCAKVASLSISVDHVHVYGLQATDQGLADGTETMSQLVTLGVTGLFTDVLVDGWRGHAARENGQGITFAHMELGNANYCTPTVEERDAMQMIPTVVAAADNDSITDSVLHDWYDGSAVPDGACGQGSSGGHDDCIQSNGGNNQTIARDLFYKCGSSSILQWGEFSGGAMGTITVENNYFGDKPTEFNILSMGQGNCSGLVIRNNVFESGAFDNDGSCTGASPTQDNNIMLGSVGSCSSASGLGFSGDHNIFVVSGGATCGTNPKRCAPSFVNGNPSGFAYWEPKLSSSDTCALDYSAASFPSTDFYGIDRPIGVTADAGASEAG